VLVGTGKKSYKSKEGYPADEEAAIQKVSAADFDAVVIPGGFAPDILRRYPEVTGFVKQMNDLKKPIACICHGGWVLCSAGFLKGRTVTGFVAIKDDLVNAGATFLDKEVVVDKNLITSRNPYDLPAFCRELIAQLKK
jgi:protease I